MYVRIWTPVKESDISSNTSTQIPWIIWDLGDRQWELKGSVFKHFKICSRRKQGEQILEYVEPLEEVPVPSGLLSRQMVGSCWVLKEESQPSSEKLQIQHPVNKGIKQQNNQKTLSSVKQSSHEKQQQEETESLVTESSQSSYILPSELWTSLSQWIPSHALFQPSLHYLASLESSDTPTPSFPSHSNQASYSQTGQARLQVREPNQQSRPYYPRNSSRTFQSHQKPLFVL